MKSELYDLKYSRPEAELFIWTPTQEHLSLSCETIRDLEHGSVTFPLSFSYSSDTDSLLPPFFLRFHVFHATEIPKPASLHVSHLLTVFVQPNRKNTLARFVQIHNISFTFLSKHVCESQTVMTVYSGLDSDASSTWSFSRGKKEENSSVLLSFSFYYFTTTVWGFSNSFVSLRAMWVLCSVHCMMGISTIIVIYLSLGWANILGAAISL